jgi:RNA-splicing ligase RtcB
MPQDGSVKLTDGGNVPADLIISGGGVAVKYNVYLSENAVKLQFRSTDRGRGELAPRLLKVTGVSAEVKRKGDGDGWYVRASTVVLASAREELRKALAAIIKTALARGLVDAGKAER